MYEDKPMARFLYDNVELNQLIPGQLLELLARIVAAIPSLSAKFQRDRVA